MTVQTNLDALDRALEEKAFNMQVLRLWAAAREAGYPPETVATFTFSDAFLNKELREVNERQKAQRKNPVYSGARYHNAVRLKSGDIAEIELMRRPEPPAHMQVSKQEKE